MQIANTILSVKAKKERCTISFLRLLQKDTRRKNDGVKEVYMKKKNIYIYIYSVVVVFLKGTD